MATTGGGGGAETRRIDVIDPLDRLQARCARAGSRSRAQFEQQARHFGVRPSATEEIALRLSASTVSQLLELRLRFYALARGDQIQTST